MRISFSSNKTEKILTNERLIDRRYNKEHAKRIKSRLTELRSAKNLNEIPQTPPPRRHKLNGEYKNCWGVDYSRNFRIVLEPIGNFDINDLSTITEVKIIALEDYH
ncbi:hypothetical protein JUM001_04060 [Clostridium perfringens]|uniref:type II toxin-antitoxin system RelE/ParE family toxin n=1 Tax=Clostridium perfringens TaxID=1502 RepID=UPI002207B93D|nr:type II toxin-antitoxin system RelE/ParE family toxin [Clostridium perfringens]BDS16172.1 hypothetical protein JUM001_04060 [Clostridium perfringens]